MVNGEPESERCKLGIDLVPSAANCGVCLTILSITSRPFVISVRHTNHSRTESQMTEQNDADQGEGESQVERLPVHIKTYIHQEVQNAIRQQNEFQSKRKKWRNSWRTASPITKVSLVLTALVAFATVANAVNAWLQLGAMKAISSDNTQQTQRLIDAANQIKAAAWDFKGSAQGIDGNLGNAVAELQSQVEKMDASRKSTDKNSAANLQATIDSFHREDRAWVGIENAIPLDYSPDTSSHSVNMVVAFTLKNYGRSAAERVRFLAVLESDPTVLSLSCDEVAAKNHAGDVLLPTQERTLNWALNLKSEQIAAGWAHQNPLLGHQLFPRIVGCLEYTDREGEQPAHRTPFTYMVFRKGGFIIPDIPIPAAELSLDLMGTDSLQTH